MFNVADNIKGINVEKFMSRQDLPELYCTSGAIYGRSYKLLQTFNPNKKSFVLGNKPVGIIVDDIEAINIDRPIDFEFAQFVKIRIPSNSRGRPMGNTTSCKSLP